MRVVFPMGDIPSMEYRIAGTAAYAFGSPEAWSIKGIWSLHKPFRQQMVRDANGVGNDRQRWINRTCRNEARSIHNIEIVEIMSLAMHVQHARRRISSHATSAVLMADTLQRDTLLEISVQRNRSRRMPGPLKYADPPVLEAIKRLNIIRRVRKLNPHRSGIRNRVGLVGVASVARRMRSAHTGLPILDR